MPTYYGQKNYSQHLGDGPYPISATGCFITAFCNLMAYLGSQIDPASLNDQFNARGLYLASPEDGAGTKDDVSWGTISGYDSTIHVTGTGGAGWPPAGSVAIMEFHYRSVQQPTLSNGEPNMINHFCLSVDTGGQVIVDSYDGITKGPSAYQSVYGEPVAWATYAKAVPQPVAPVPVAEPIAPAPTPAPAAPAKPANTDYTKLDAPMNLVTNKQPTHKWELDFVDDAHAVSNAILDANTPFVAFGKAQRTDGDKPAYFMDQSSFGSADTTGIPDNNVGINTVDLSPAPVAAAAPTPAPVETPTAPVGGGESIPVTVVPTDTKKWQQSFTSFLGVVEYHGAAPAAGSSFWVVKDVDGVHPDSQLFEGQLVKIAGWFMGPDGVKYFRTETSVKNDTWYGLTAEMITGGTGGDEDIDNLLDLHLMDDIDDEVKKIKTTSKQKVLAGSGTLVGFVAMLLQKLHLKK